MFFGNIYIITPKNRHCLLIIKKFYYFCCEKLQPIVSLKRNPPLMWNLSVTGNYKYSSSYIELTLISENSGIFDNLTNFAVSNEKRSAYVT